MCLTMDIIWALLKPLSLERYVPCGHLMERKASDINNFEIMLYKFLYPSCYNPNMIATIHYMTLLGVVKFVDENVTVVNSICNTSHLEFAKIKLIFMES